MYVVALRNYLTDLTDEHTTRLRNVYVADVMAKRHFGKRKSKVPVEHGPSNQFIKKNIRTKTFSMLKAFPLLLFVEGFVTVSLVCDFVGFLVTFAISSV